jgi:type I restriction enzyme M protein
MFHGFDFDATMLRVASMNLMLHGVENPDIHNQDTLSSAFPDRFAASRPRAASTSSWPTRRSRAAWTSDVHPSLTREGQDQEDRAAVRGADPADAEAGGRSATIVPDGVLFGSSKAHKELRKMLVEEHSSRR